MLSRSKRSDAVLRCCALRKSCCVWLVAAGILLAWSGSLEAATYYVRTDGNDANSGTGSDAANAWATVDGAANKALSAGDVIYVKAGNYAGFIIPSVSGTAASSIKFIADTAGSVSDWAPGDVVISAFGPNRSLEITNHDYIEFIAFKFEGTTGHDTIQISAGTGIVFERCEIFGSSKIGIEFDGGSLDVINCLLRDNGYDGIHVTDGTLTVWNSTITGNQDGLEMDAGTVTVTNSIIYNNSSEGLDVNGGTMTHTYNLVYGNGGNNWEGTSPSTGEISVDPLFVSTTDFHLRSTSPGRDAGVSAPGAVDDDFHGNPRPENGSWDMGYHEYAATQGYTPLLLVTVNSGYLTTQERHRKTLFEAWDYSVTTIWAGDTQANFDTALATVAVAYVSEEVDPSDVAYKLRETTVGVVNEEPALTDEFGIATLDAGNVTDNVMNVADNSHDITSSFALGSLTLFSSAQDANYLNGTIATGAQVLGDWSGSGTLAAIDTGATLATTYNSSNLAFGRRVQLPFGSSAFDFSSLTDDGKTLVQRALEWASIGMVGHWTFDEGAGTTIADSSIYGNDASFNTGTPTWISGVRGGALEFDGTNDAITGASFKPPARGTVAFWFRSDGPPASRQRLWGNGGDYEMWQDPDGLVSCDVSTDGFQGGFITTTPLYEAGRWYHLAAVYNSDDDSYKIYINGELHKSGVSTWAMVPQPSALLSFGTRTGSTQRFSGALDDFRIFNYKLSAIEVADLYGLVGHWPMDEGIGATAADSTAYGNDATLSGATWTSDCNGQSGLEFDGLGDTAATNAPFDPPDTGAIAVWLRSAGNPGARSRPFGVGDNWEMRQEPDGTLSFDLGGEGPPEFITTEGLSYENRWYHVVAQFDASDDSFEVYVDGDLVDSGINSSDMVKQLANTLTFGTRTGNIEYWEGGMRDFRVYNRPLLDYEIAKLASVIAHWKLDETSGSVAVDASTAGNDATYVGSPTLGVPGAFPAKTVTAVALDGTSQSISSGASLLNDLTQFTLAGWVRPNSTTPDKSFFGQYDLIELGVDNATNQIDLWTSSGGSISAIAYLLPGKWSHLAAVGTGAELKLYINGVEIASGGSVTANYGTNSEAFKIGEGVLDTTGDYFDGGLDDVRVFSRAPCPDEIWSLYKVGRPSGVRIIKWIEVR